MSTVDWQRSAACDGVGDERFFAWSVEIARSVAQQYCSVCPVRTPCLAHGKATGSSGVFGGHLLSVAGRAEDRDVDLLKEAA